MQTDTLALYEFFVEIVCTAADLTPSVPSEGNLDNDDSFFCSIEDNMEQYTTLQDLLHGQDNLLMALVENWKKEEDKPWQMLVQIDQFIIENKAYFERSKIPVRTILDYVYTIV